jgi:hypothetical protein
MCRSLDWLASRLRTQIIAPCTDSRTFMITATVRLARSSQTLSSPGTSIIDHHSPEKIAYFRQLAQFSALQYHEYCLSCRHTKLSLRNHTLLVLALCLLASEDTVQHLRVIMHDVQLPSMHSLSIRLAANVRFTVSARVTPTMRGSSVAHSGRTTVAFNDSPCHRLSLMLCVAFRSPW